MRLNTQKRVVQKSKAVVLFGPTAVGKTGMTETLFSRSAEIINADSVQVYRGLDIGSAKPDEHLRKLIRHHLIDIRDPWEQYTAGDFVRDAESLIPEIIERGIVPLVTGGTGYYIKQLVYGPSSAPPSDNAVREAVKAEIEEKGSAWAWEYLAEVDPVSAERINPNDVYRVSRAIEVYRISGRALSSYPVSASPRTDIDFILICLVRDKSELDKRIAMRVDQMFDMGLYDEIKRLFRSGASRDWPGMHAIGYQEFLDAAETGEASVRTIKEDIIRASMQYAKRQMTFFRSFATCRFFHPDDLDGLSDYLAFNGIGIDGFRT